MVFFKQKRHIGGEQWERNNKQKIKKHAEAVFMDKPEVIDETFFVWMPRGIQFAFRNESD